MSSADSPLSPLHLCLLDAHLSFVTDDEDVADRVRAELGAFLVEQAAGPDVPQVELRLSPPPARLRGLHETHVLDPELARTQAFPLIFREALDRIDSSIVLHAAAVERDGAALLLGGPSESGKTTLTLALLARGFRLLSDDFSPLDRATGLVRPFPKALGIRPGAARQLAFPDRQADPAAPEREPLEPRVIDGCTLAPAPARPALLVLFDGAAHPPNPREPFLLGVRCFSGVDDLAEGLAAIPGVRIISLHSDGVVVQLDPAQRASIPVQAEIDRRGARVLEYGLMPRTRVRQAPARLRPMRTSDAVALVLREVQNRRQGSALLQSVGGDASLLLLELARHLGRTPAVWLSPGEPAATAELLDRAFDQLAGQERAR
jgi:hypothetical protein